MAYVVDGNYPIMSQSEQERAPWNEPMLPEMVFDVETTVTLSRVVSVKTGRCSIENVDCKSAYRESGHLTIPELLKELSEYVEEDLAKSAPNTVKYAHLKRLVEDCHNWNVIDESYEAG